VEAEAFLQRVLSHLGSGSDFSFGHWSHLGRPTDEAVGMLRIAGIDPKRFIDAVMDVDHYVGNVANVSVCKSKDDPRYVPPAVRFYQRIDIPVLGALQHELVLRSLGEHKGFSCAGWDLLADETNALDPKRGARSDYNHGLWLAGNGMVGYALGSAPKREDVGLLKWKALTTGADVAAPKVIRQNIEGMAKWSARRGARA
jgi:hypothetical protein